MSHSGMAVRSILVRNWWTSIEYDQLDFGLLVPCAMAFFLINGCRLVTLRVNNV